MKFVGVDYGLARTGLAVSDPEGRLAFPLETLRLEDFTDRKVFLAALAERIMPQARLRRAASRRSRKQTRHPARVQVHC